MSLLDTETTPEWHLRCLSDYLGDSRLETPRAQRPGPESFQAEIDDRGRKEGENLGDDKASDNGDSEGAAKLGADAETDG
jgi:hypothetical protein